MGGSHCPTYSGGMTNTSTHLPSLCTCESEVPRGEPQFTVHSDSILWNSLVWSFDLALRVEIPDVDTPKGRKDGWFFVI